MLELRKTKRALAMTAATLALAGGSAFVTGGTAHAAGVGQVCRQWDVSADGLSVHVCLEWDEVGGYPNPLWGHAETYGTNNTTINLCVRVLDQNLNEIPGSRGCRVVWGPSGSMDGPAVYVPPCRPGGTKYYAEAWFTSPTFYYGGMTGALAEIC